LFLFKVKERGKWGVVKNLTSMLDGQFDWDSLHLNNNGGDPKAVKIIVYYGPINRAHFSSGKIQA